MVAGADKQWSQTKVAFELKIQFQGIFKGFLSPMASKFEKITTYRPIHKNGYIILL